MGIRCESPDRERSRGDMTVDDLDARILTALGRDGRATIREIARTTGAPATTVQERVRTLEENSVIQGYVPRLDYGSLGYELTVVLRLSVDGDALTALTGRLRDEARIIAVYEVTGRFDVVAIGKYTDADEMTEQVRWLLSDSAVRVADTSLVLDVVREYEPLSIAPDGHSRE